MQVNLGSCPAEWAERLRRLETAGLDEAWVAESYGADAVSMLGYLAAATQNLTLGAGILNVYSRTPALLAMSAVGLDLLSRQRFVLGVGASGPQVVEGLHGIAFEHPVTRLEAVIDACRTAWRRESVVVSDPVPAPRPGGRGRPMKLLARPGRAIPIYVAGLGGRTVELAASKADGWMPLFFFPERAEEVWGDAIRRGTTHRSPELPPLEIVAGGVAAITDDNKEAVRLRDLARPTLARYLGAMGPKGMNYYHALVARYGFASAADEVQEHYLAGRRKEAEAAIPHALVDGITLVGTAAQVRERVAAYRGAGVTSLCVEPVIDEETTIAELRTIVAEVGR